METRACVRCQVERSAAAFPSHRGQIHGARCKPCLAELRRVERANAPPKPARPLDRDRAEKTCKRCGVTKPVSEFIWSGDRWSAACRPCTSEIRASRWRRDIEASRAKDRAAYQRARRDRIAKRQARYSINPEPVREAGRRYWWKHREQRMAANRAWREANRERFLANMRRWREANREYVRATMQTYYAANADKWVTSGQRRYAERGEHIRQLVRTWRLNNPDLVAGYAMRRRARMAAVSVGPVSRQAVIARDKGICYLCGRSPKGWQLTLDHVVSLAAGGEHSEANLRVACRSCNSRKNHLPLSEVLHRFATVAVQGRLI